MSSVTPFQKICEQAFQEFDQNNDGVLQRDELEPLINEICKGLSFDKITKH